MLRYRAALVLILTIVVLPCGSIFAEDPPTGVKILHEKVGSSAEKTVGKRPSVKFRDPRPAVVRVAADEGDGISYGTGTLVGCNDQHGVVLTNWHVVRDATGEISVKFANGSSAKAEVLKTDSTWDLAALLISRPEVEPVEVATDIPQNGDTLTIAGYGKGKYREATGSVVQYVSPGGDHPFEIVEVGVGARQGDSGGPILNEDGKVAGVLFGSANGCTNGSHCRRVRWFLRRALANRPLLRKACRLGPPGRIGGIFRSDRLKDRSSIVR